MDGNALLEFLVNKWYLILIGIAVFIILIKIFPGTSSLRQILRSLYLV